MSDLDRYKYGYDQNSNRQWKQNVVATSAGKALDEYYTYDALNRMTSVSGTDGLIADYAYDGTCFTHGDQ
jgi:hypothetical protein